MSFSAGDPVPFSGVADSAGTITNHGYWNKVVFDLSTTKAPSVTPVLFAHDDRISFGRTDTLSITSDIKVSGVIYADVAGAKILSKPGHR